MIAEARFGVGCWRLFLNILESIDYVDTSFFPMEGTCCGKRRTGAECLWQQWRWWRLYGR
jgi:hypothetical protein